MTRPSYPVVAALLALTLSLTSGSAVAARMITGKDLPDGVILFRDVKPNTLRGTTIGTDAIATSRNIATDAVGPNKIAPAAVDSDDVKQDSLKSEDFRDGSIESIDLAPEARIALARQAARSAD